MTTDRRALVDDALDYLGEILGINFVQTTHTDSKVDIFYKDNGSGSYSNAKLFNTLGNGTDNHRHGRRPRSLARLLRIIGLYR